MISPDYVRLMAAYTQWQNRSVFGAADTLSDAARREHRGAFFGSIHATLNHVLWGDQIWLHRLADMPAPPAVGIAGSTSIHEDWSSLRDAREQTDLYILEWGARVTVADLSGHVTWYSNSRQETVEHPRWALVVQLFNHGTHHRGQVHAMLTATGAKPEDTDIQYVPVDQGFWDHL